MVPKKYSLLKQNEYNLESNIYLCICINQMQVFKEQIEQLNEKVNCSEYKFKGHM